MSGSPGSQIGVLALEAMMYHNDDCGSCEVTKYSLVL